MDFDKHQSAVLIIAQELRAYEEYLAGRIDKETYLKADSRDLIVDSDGGNVDFEIGLW